MTGKLALFIDGVEVAVPAGATVLDAARAAGARIPTLCDHPDLAPHGGCRLCVVEVEGSERLFASCVTPAAAGMRVRTATDRVRAARQAVLELILAYHPLECPVCPQSGRCALQDAVFSHGLAAGRFGSAPPRRGVDRVSPLIENNQDRCILCGRCVRICDEVQGEGNLSFKGRGFPSTVGTAFGHPWDCEFCGQCFQACPVGALYSRPFAHTAPLWELAPVVSACTLCGVGCTASAQTRRGTVHLMLGERGSGAVNRGHLCSKGRFGHAHIGAPGRLTTPLARVEGRLAPVSWEEAFSRTAIGVRAALSTGGAQAVGGILSPLAANEDAFVFGRLLRAVIGSNSVDTVSRGDLVPAGLALRAAFGLSASTMTLPGLASSDLIFAVEANLTEDSHIAGLEVLRRTRHGGARLLVAHGRRVKLTRFAHRWARPLPGRAAGLLHAMAAVILAEGLEAREFCKRRVAGLPALRESLAAWAPEKAAAATGVPADEIRALAREFAAAKNAAILLAPGAGSPLAAGELAAAAANLALLTGNLGREGAGVLLLTEFANSQGVLDMGGLPEFLPGWQSAADPAARAWFGGVWGAELPEAPGLTAPAMLRAAAEGSLGALLVMGEDLLRAFPDRALVERALGRVPFLAVSALTLTATAARAHVVFPAAAGLEKGGSVTSGDRRIQLLRPAVPPPGGARADRSIWGGVEEALGYRTRSGSGEDSAAVLDEIAAALPSHAGVSAARLAAGALAWPCPDPEHPGTGVLYAERFFSGVGRLRPPAPPAGPELAEGRPFLLVTGTLRHHLGGLLVDAGELSKLVPEARAELHPGDAARLSLAEGDLVRITSRAGSLEVRAALTDRTRPGTVFLPVHFFATPWNTLVDQEAALSIVEGGEPVAVAVEKVD